MTVTKTPSGMEREVRVDRVVVFLLMGLALLLACSPPASDPEHTAVASSQLDFSSTGLDRIREQVRGDIAAGTIAGAVVLLDHGGETVLFESFGHRDIHTQDPMSNDTIFRIFSFTKPITSVAVMMLHERGQLDIDDPVMEFLPDLGGREVLLEGQAGPDGSPGVQRVIANREITIRDLLGHTGGLTYGFFEDTPVDRMYGEAGVLIGATTIADTVERLSKLPLKYQPGTVWEYSVSTDVLGRLIEVVSGREFDAFLKEELFRPLGMHDTGFFVPVAKLPRLAGYYEQTDEGLRTVEEPVAVDKRPSYLSGGGGLYSTAADYLAFCRMILNGGAVGETRILEAESIEEMAVDRLADFPGRSENTLKIGSWIIPGGFGLGFAVNQVESPIGTSRRLFWYGIASTMFWIDPDHDLIGIYMVQHRPFEMGLGNRFRELSYEAASRLEQSP
jgi:CubicO group peptidase (beta-lactamase class C family)